MIIIYWHLNAFSCSLNIYKMQWRRRIVINMWSNWIIIGYILEVQLEFVFITRDNKKQFKPECGYCGILERVFVLFENKTVFI